MTKTPPCKSRLCYKRLHHELWDYRLVPGDGNRYKTSVTNRWNQIQVVARNRTQLVHTACSLGDKTQFFNSIIKIVRLCSYLPNCASSSNILLKPSVLFLLWLFLCSKSATFNVALFTRSRISLTWALLSLASACNIRDRIRESRDSLSSLMFYKQFKKITWFHRINYYLKILNINLLE